MKTLLSVVIALTLMEAGASASTLDVKCVLASSSDFTRKEVQETAAIYFKEGSTLWTIGYNQDHPIIRIDQITGSIGIGKGKIDFGPTLDYKDSELSCYGMVSDLVLPIGQTKLKGTIYLQNSKQGVSLSTANLRLTKPISKTAETGIGGIAKSRDGQLDSLIGILVEKQLGHISVKARIGQGVSGSLKGEKEVKIDFLIRP